MDEVRDYVRRYRLGELLSPDLLDLLQPFRRGPGELLLRAGDPATHLLFFVAGRTKVYSTMENGHSLLAAFYEPFDVLGEAELFTSERYALNVEAVTNTLCLSLPAPAVKKAVDRNSRLLIYLCGRLGTKLAERVIIESINLRYPVENRLASYLLAVMDSEGWIIGTDDLGELADFIGASYRQLARVVRRFRDRGILDETRGRVRVLDRKKLEPLAGDRYSRKDHDLGNPAALLRSRP